MEILRYSAFTTDPSGGNPAGVVLDATGADDARMQSVAAEVGYSETAFLTPTADRTFDVRYFSPQAEVPFCGHATIAAAVAFARRHGTGPLTLHTKAGLVGVTTSTVEEDVRATLVSVPPRVEPLSDDDLAALLRMFGWTPDELDPTLPPRVVHAGVWHPILAAASRQRLAGLDYDMPALGVLMSEREWTTVDLVWRESDTVFHARNPFPPGGVVEDPATGAAAAALGGYLRALRLVDVPTSLTVHQGVDMGRPSLLAVEVPEGDGGIHVSGTAVSLGDEEPS